MSSKHCSFSNLKLFFLISILIISMITVVLYLPNPTENNPKVKKPYFGVSFTGNTTHQAKLLIEKIKDYTNLLILQSGPISKNETATNIICDYATDAGLDFIVFFGWFDPTAPWQIPWLTYAKNRWGNKFIGVYFFDEPGGIQLDHNWEFNFHHIKEVDPEFYETIKEYIEEDENQTLNRDYKTAKDTYIEYLQNHLQLSILNNMSITAFTSDYALYWFDYIAGYDTIFVELGWNQSTEKHIALCRGAATLQRKEWGTIIVWNDLDEETKNTDSHTGNPPRVPTGDYKTGSEMLNDMLTSYNAGADYIIIFNYPTDPPGNPYGILTDEHFEAMQQFYNYMKQNPEEYGNSTAQASLVLPENYAWGMRQLDDRIWGYWGPDEKSEQIWNLSQKLLDQYGLSLDIIYDDPNNSLEEIYPKIIYWNSTD